MRKDHAKHLGYLNEIYPATDDLPENANPDENITVSDQPETNVFPPRQGAIESPTFYQPKVVSPDVIVEDAVKGISSSEFNRIFREIDNETKTDYLIGKAKENLEARFSRADYIDILDSGDEIVPILDRGDNKFIDSILYQCLTKLQKNVETIEGFKLWEMDQEIIPVIDRESVESLDDDVKDKILKRIENSFESDAPSQADGFSSANMVSDTAIKGTTVFTQCAVNSFVRQILTNAKVRSEGSNTVSDFVKMMSNPKDWAEGYKARVSYQLSAMGPSMMLREYLSEDLSAEQLSVACAIGESAIGMFLELKANAKSLIKSGANPELATQSSFAAQNLSTSSKIFTPSFLRNICAWAAANTNETDPVKKAGYGVVGGIASSPLDTFVSRTAIHSSWGKSWLESYGDALKDIVKMDKRVMVGGSFFRGGAAAFAAIITSPQFGEVVRDSYKSLHDMIVQGENRFNHPSESPTMTEKTPVKTQTRER